MVWLEHKLHSTSSLFQSATHTHTQNILIILSWMHRSDTVTYTLWMHEKVKIGFTGLVSLDSIDLKKDSDWHDFLAAVSVLSEERHAQFFKHTRMPYHRADCWYSAHVHKLTKLDNDKDINNILHRFASLKCNTRNVCSCHLRKKNRVHRYPTDTSCDTDSVLYIQICWVHSQNLTSKVKIKSMTMWKVHTKILNWVSCVQVLKMLIYKLL